MDFNKRHILVFSIFIVQTLVKVASENEVFIVTKQECITNGSSAIIFNDAISNIIKQSDGIVNDQTSYTFYPSSNVSLNIDCRIEKDEDCISYWTNQKWRLIDSVTGGIDNLITDRRWEDFKLYKTEYVDTKYKFLNYEKVLFTNVEDFEIAFSVRIEQEAHVFLCDNERPYESNCLWIMLDAFKKTKSVIRQCEENFIDATYGSWPQPPCKDERAVNDELILNENIWRHFKVTKRDKFIIVSHGNHEILRHLQDFANPFSPRYLFFHSKRVDGLWKLHFLTYIYCTEITLQQLGPKDIVILQNKNCISMFIVMCSECTMMIHIETGSDVLFQQKFTTVNEKWKEIKIMFTSSYQSFGKLLVKTDSGATSGNYWAIDDIRQCEENEYRVLKSTKDNLPCERIDNNDVLNIVKEDVNDNRISDISCPETSFGKYCVPCEIFGGSICNQFKYCEWYDQSTKCSCTAGYHSKYCSACSYMKYGHNCKQTCKHCNGGCDAVTGICNSQYCLNNYSGPKCNIPLAPIIKFPPEVINILPTSCTIKLTSRELQEELEEPPNFFQIQYKEAFGSEWTPLNKVYQFAAIPAQITLTNLVPETEYYIRILVYSDNNYIYTGDQIPFSSFRTSCHNITEDDLEIISTNETATISIKLNEGSCRINEYKYSVNGRNEEPANEMIELKDLSPYTPYNFSLFNKGRQARISKTFKTEEGVPLGVENIEQIGNATNEISLSWSEPKLKYGEIQYYIIKYKRLRGRSCLGQNNQLTETAMYENPIEKEITLKNLIPYSKYDIQISAVTAAGAGKFVYKEGITAPLESILESEVPGIIRKTNRTTQVEITLATISCNDLRGSVYILSTAKCYSEWCVTPNIKRNIYNPSSNTIVVPGLFPFTNYSLSMKFSRELNWSSPFIIITNVTTEPSVPNSIKELGVTSKDKNSISLRWTPPYPPTGKLNRYNIKYNLMGSRYLYDKEVYPKSCKIWSSYHCTTITKNVIGGSYFYIEIWGSNEVPNSSKKLYETIRILTAETVSEAPYDIEGNWSNGDDLIISWKHPNATNGVLQRFLIHLTKNDSTNPETFKLNIDGEKDYNLTYTYTIDKNKLDPCTTYSVQVEANNKFRGNSVDLKNVLSPPPTPPNIPEETVETYSTNQSITIKIPELKYQQKNLENCNMTLYMLISNYSDTGDNSDVEIFKNHLLKQNDLTFTNSRIVYESNQSNLPLTFQLGNDSTFQSTKKNYSNPPLESGKEYIIYLFFVNKHDKTMRINQMSKKVFTTLYTKDSSETSNGKMYVLILLLLFIPLIYLGYRYRHIQRKGSSKTFTNLITSYSSQETDSIPLKDKEPTKVSVVKPMILTKPRSFRESFPPIKTEHSKPVKILAIETYVKDSIQNGELQRQHELFPRGQTRPWQYGSVKANKSKNRYNNLIAYDHTRVKLNKLEGKEYSDYINANYIDGYKYPRAYIATQGPKVSTLNDFWRMIWQENVKHIVMLANIYENEKKKVEKYWPDINETKDFNGIKVQYESSVIFADYEYRIFTVSYDDEQRKVHQLHFTTWPDHGVPLYPQSLVPFLQNILKIPYNSNSPVVIHCSAGVGRTGTIILCDICLRMAASGGTIDFLANLEYLRSQRPNMVDNVEQYKLAHLVVLDCLCGMRTSIKCNDDMEKTVEDLLNNDAVKMQMRYLKENEWQIKALDSVNLMEEDIPIYPEKNRFQDILPDLQHRVFITRYPPSDEKSAYINAVQIDGFRSPGRFIVTQQPMPNTLGDFWRLVYERKITVIISLNKINTKDKSSCQFWPINGGTITPVDYIKITHTNTRLLNYYEIVTLRMQISQKTQEIQNEEENITIEIVSLENWKSSDLLPNSIEEFLSFWEESNAIARQSHPVIITCHNGARACGLYIAMSFLIEKMNLERECDVCLAVQNIRHHRRQFVDSEEQFEFLYRICATYISGFQSYANFE